jgi:predicted ester cyclase
MATPQENAATCREFIERVFNENDISFAEKTLSEDFVDHSPPPGMAGDKASMIEMFGMMADQFPDGRTDIIDVVAAGDKVCVRSRMTGTDTNGFMPGMPPTGKPYSAESIDVMTFNENGQNSQHYGIFDVPAVMVQLGLMPGPEAG